MKTLTILFIVFSIFISANAQDSTSIKVALLPIISNGIDYTSVQTAESILRMELGNQKNLDVVSERKTLTALDGNDCTDEECAKIIGNKLEAKQVLLCKLNPLGEKLIVQYQLVETSTGNNILSERATATNIEDLDAVMKRVAISVAKQTPFNSNQEVGNIVQQESIESLRQKARYNFGLGFGYLFPIHGYDTDKKSFTLNAYFDYELQDYAVGFMLGARKGFAINLYGNYLFTRTDVCPYLGGSLGFHWVYNHSDENRYYFDPNPNNKDEDGIELGLETGVRLLHTYSFQLFIKGEYIMTFNDFNDKAFVFTIGIL
jgi:TolB-like protein